jgi:uncharacterized protein YggE
MNNNNHSFLKFLLIFVLGFLSFYLLQNVPALNKISLFNPEISTITVQGSAQKDVLNQVAEFTAGIEVIATEKEEAVNLANEIMDQVLTEIYAFGIKQEDVQTSQVSVYQEDQDFIEPMLDREIMIDEEIDTGKRGDWRANISLSITMRNEDSSLLQSQSEALLNLLNNSQVNYVYGPNFRLDEQNLSEIDLINSAVADARSKAEAIAASSQQKITKVLEIIESDVNYQPFYRAEMAADLGSISNSSLEPGSSRLSKSVTVTFQVK